MKKEATVLLFLIVFLTIMPFSYAVTCDFSGWPLPDLSPENTIMLDGYEWSVEEESDETTFIRKITRLDIQFMDNGLLNKDEILDRTSEFLERNSAALGIPDDAELEIREEGVPISIYFLVVDQQYCNGLPVIGTLAGVVTAGETEERDIEIASLGFKWYLSIELNTTNPTITLDDLENVTDAELAILPLDDDTFLLVWDTEDEDGDHEYIDAHTGEVVEGGIRDTGLGLKPKKPEFKLDILHVINGIILLIIAGVSVNTYKDIKRK